MKLLHAADLHIDSPLRGLDRYPGAPAEHLRNATRTAVDNLVSLALEEEVTAVLLAGDIYDGSWRDVNTGLYFTKQMRRLREADIRVFMISGNHDAENKMTMRLTLPDNVHLFPSESADSSIHEDLGLAVHGQSFAQAKVTDDLAAGYRPAAPGLFNVGLLHTSLNGRPGHDRYAPCNLEQLVDHGYDYWALGHIHKREVVHGDGVHVVFPGNTQGRHAGETGDKGCTLVTVDGAGAVEGLEHRDLDTAARWHEVRVDMTGALDLDDACHLVERDLQRRVTDHAVDGRVDAVRVVAVGAGEAHSALLTRREEFTAEVRGLSQDYPSVWIEKVRVDTSRPRERVASERFAGLVADVREEAARLADDPERVREVLDGAGLRGKLPAEVRTSFEEDGWAERMAGGAADLLVAMLEESR
ncbi:metallophosphoesterase family protein [Nocardiopsis lambiniae]|uniref:DNA repair exonuclease n=1 Tax=Nocardiopsis lambiniae TaxID=3075539 RepID=A0ABU2M6B4_9ACTN|nr:DNA repair exonuclease [Nocardiopsis sp. DSM 44743]MDT0327546.1 DNA repair exonuclease [Nocardiopsis sp. DSM 44743]